MSYLWGVLSQSLRSKEPDLAEQRANINIKISCTIKQHLNQYDTNIQEVFFNGNGTCARLIYDNLPLQINKLGDTDKVLYSRYPLLLYVIVVYLHIGKRPIANTF